MVRSMNIEAIENGIGVSWSTVEDFLDGIDATTLSHQDIAQALNESGLAEGWWAQSATLPSSSRSAGASRPGLRRRVSGLGEQDGTRQHGAGAGSSWVSVVGGAEEFSGFAMTRGPELTDTANGATGVAVWRTVPGSMCTSTRRPQARPPSACSMNGWSRSSSSITGVLFWKAKLGELA